MMLGMPAKSKRPQRKLHIGEWIAATGRRPVEVARALDIGEAYVSQLISGQRKNPSTSLLIDLSEFLGITVNDLARPPSATDIGRAFDALDPPQRAALGALIANMKAQSRK